MSVFLQACIDIFKTVCSKVGQIGPLMPLGHGKSLWGSILDTVLQDYRVRPTLLHMRLILQWHNQ